MQINIALLAIAFLSAALISETKGAEKAKAKMNDVVEKFDLRLKNWEERKVLKILICPIIIGGKDDPFNQKMRLNVNGFGELSEQESVKLLRILKEGEKEVLPLIDHGTDVELIFLMKNGGYEEETDRIKFRIFKNDIVMFLQTDRGEYRVKLPRECHKLISSNFLK